MNCPRCGAEVEPGSVFCGECGFRLPTQQPPREPESQRTELPWEVNAADTLVGQGPYHLSVIEGPEKGKVVPLLKDMRLGRGTDNDIVLSDLRVSRQHGMITVRGRDCIVSDLGSPNGLFVNSVRITGPQALKEGDRVRMGDTVLVFSQNPAAAPGGMQPPQQPVDTAVRQRPVPLPPPPPPAAVRQPARAAAPQSPPFASSYAPPAPPMPQFEIVDGRRVIRAVRQGGTPTRRWITYSCSLILILILLAVVLAYLVMTRVQVSM